MARTMKTKDTTAVAESTVAAMDSLQADAKAVDRMAAADRIVAAVFAEDLSLKQSAHTVGSRISKQAAPMAALQRSHRMHMWARARDHPLWLNPRARELVALVAAGNEISSQTKPALAHISS